MLPYFKHHSKTISLALGQQQEDTEAVTVHSSTQVKLIRQ